MRDIEDCCRELHGTNMENKVEAAAKAAAEKEEPIKNGVRGFMINEEAM